MFYRLIQGDCIKVLKTLPDNSIDCCVTDPPYGIGFMGKDWDQVLPPKEAFEQIFRVLKYGALAFVMSSPRQDVLWRMLKMLEECGFELQQSFVSWIYKSGFPKAYDVSKGIDKKLGLKRKVIGKRIEKSGHKSSMKTNLEQGYRPNDYYKDKDDFINITKPASDLSEKWQGWKSVAGLKPALECILMVNKPLGEKTIVDNVLKHGVGAINVDACRIPYKSIEDKKQAIPQGRITTRVGSFAGRTQKGIDRELDRQKWKDGMKGRFPANLLCGLGIDIDLQELLELQEELKT